MTSPTSLFIRLYLDVNIQRLLAPDLVTRGIDAIHALDLGHELLSDELHLRWAARDGRALLSFDRGDYHQLATEWLLRGETHRGIIMSKAPPRLPVATFHRRLINLLDHVTADEMINEIRWLDQRWS